MKTKAIKNAQPIQKFEVEAVKNLVNDFLKGLSFKYIGSLGFKETSSDVDVVVKDVNFPQLIETIEERTLEYKYSPGFGLLSVGLEFRDKVIQLDIFNTKDFGWSDFMFGGNRQRNQLLMAIIVGQTKQFTDKTTYNQYNLRVDSGLWKTTKTTVNSKGQPLKNPKIIDSQWVTSNPTQILTMFHIPQHIVHDFNLLLEYYDSDTNPFRHEIMNKFREYQND